MFLSKRCNGIYYIYYENRFGKRACKSTKAKTKSEALKFLSEYRKLLSKSRFNDLITIKLKEFIWEYLKNSESIHRPKTTKLLKGILNEFNSFLDKPLLHRIEEKHARSYLRKKSTVSNYTAQQHLAYLRSAFNYAKKNHYVNQNPFAEIDNYRIPQKQPKYFSEDEYRLLLNAVDNLQFKNIIEIALNTGLRQMEILTLRWNQIIFKDRYLMLNNLNYINKGKKVRTIPLNIRALQIFNSIEQTHDDYIFSVNHEPLKQDFVSKKFKKYVKKAKINPQLNFHSLRHTFASWLVQKGVDIYQVSKLLGHADIKTTQIYAHLRPEDLRLSIDRLN